MSKLTLRRFAAVLSVPLLLTSGCSSSSSDEAKAAKPKATQSAAAYPYKFENGGANVDKAQFGKDWPLTLKSGRVNCNKESNNSVVVMFTADDGQSYALNGYAKAKSQMDFYHLKAIDPIWADNPDTGAKRDIGVLIDVCQPLM